MSNGSVHDPVDDVVYYPTRPETHDVTAAGLLADVMGTLLGLLESSSAATLRDGTQARRRACVLYETLGALIEAADADAEVFGAAFGPDAGGKVG